MSRDSICPASTACATTAPSPAISAGMACSSPAPATPARTASSSSSPRMPPPPCGRRSIETGGGSGLVPAGLASRDTLRLEAGMPLYGHELTTDILP